MMEHHMIISCQNTDAASHCRSLKEIKQANKGASTFDHGFQLGSGQSSGTLGQEYIALRYHCLSKIFHPRNGGKINDDRDCLH